MGVDSIIARISMKHIFSLLALVVVTGCHLPRYTWVKPGATPEDVQRAIRECQMEAASLPPQYSQPATPTYQPPSSYNVQQNYPGNYTVTPESSLGNSVNQLNQQRQQNTDAWGEYYRQQDYFNACMQAKGYTRQRIQ
jgi:hypothetical protein